MAAPSITKQQSKALADSFLDSIGSGSKGDLQPRETISELLLLAGEFIEDAQNNLISSNSIASGALSASLSVDQPIATPGKITVNIEMLPYGKFVNAGVKGTETGSSTAGYAFKNGFPSNKMANEIQKWIKRASISSRTVKHAVSPLEHKRKSISQLNQGRSVAFAVAVNIKRYGLKPTGFIDKAVKTTSDKVEDRLGAAFEIDIINSISI